MKPEDIEELLEAASRRNSDSAPNAETITRIERSILSDLRPVKPMASAWLLASGLACAVTIAAIVVAVVSGLHGYQKLNLEQRLILIPLLLLASFIAALANAREMRPASGASRGGATLIATGGVLSLSFILVFPPGSVTGFISRGIPCLAAGFALAIAVSGVLLFIVKRGYIQDRRSAGLSLGLLGGLGGMMMLQLHCPILQGFHLVVWHALVLPISALAGYAAGGWLGSQTGQSGRD